MRYFLVAVLFLLNTSIHSQQIAYDKQGRSIVITIIRGQISGQILERLRITPYGDHIIRIQTLAGGQDPFPDDHYEMVETHQWPGQLIVSDRNTELVLNSTASTGLETHFDKANSTLSFFEKGMGKAFLSEAEPTMWTENITRVHFNYDAAEHFTGLGHGYYGRAESIDLKGQEIGRNYGSEHSQQAPLIVPFYLSSKGYGVFLNSTFPNLFNFGKQDQYEFSISGDGRMDYFVIAGPSFSDILDRYTQLTGRPRMPLKSFFGLGLSDKGNDHNSTDPSDENWWKNKINQHRLAGFPLDHVINDNRWRAGGGQRCISYFEWDRGRYPDPSEYSGWLKKNGLITTLDFNRCIAVQSEGWQPGYNLPDTKEIEFNTSAPNLTKKEVRDWFWKLAWSKSLNPTLNFPGDALWIDEFDEMGKAPLEMKLENGRTWQEMKNYWFFLVAKSLVQQGWDKDLKGIKRPFVWVRGMTAGAQRYATLWSGDIRCTYDEMKLQVRGLQLAGLSGFPFWGHDAGGFNPENSKYLPDDNMYRQWSMALGSFTPFWKPHGPGNSRWPLDRSKEVQKDAMKYCRLRYELIPYIYTYAHIASEKGKPMARAMVIDHQNEANAWKYDLQYYWGNEFLVAPDCSVGKPVTVWLPQGRWYEYITDTIITGGNDVVWERKAGELPLFVKAGSIIPMANYALSTAFIHEDSLTLHVYPGADGQFELYEDDGKTELYKNKQQFRITLFTFNQKTFSLTINPSKGNYEGAPLKKTYRIIFHGAEKAFNISVNNEKYQKSVSKVFSKGLRYDEKSKTLEVHIPAKTVGSKLTIKKL